MTVTPDMVVPLTSRVPVTVTSPPIVRSSVNTMSSVTVRSTKLPVVKFAVVPVTVVPVMLVAVALVNKA